MNTERASIVIVESQPMMRMALSTTLSSEGMSVLAEVANSSDALQAASDLTPDLILFSINSSSLNDMWRISVLRQEIPNAKIVALITGEFQGQVESAMQYGAHLVLTKNASRAELLSALNRISIKRNYPATLQVD